ncbi:MAG: stage II sporulation protein P [Desulfitobacteriia bacterium]
MYYRQTWVKTLAVILFIIAYLFFMYLCVTHDSSNYIIRVLSEKSFPFQLLLLEGAPGLSQPERAYLDEVRKNTAALGMYALTGVNISDARTYFLNFFAPPKEGLSWTGWAYHPDDPEMEGLILEPLENPFFNEPAPITSANDALVGIYHTHNAESYSGGGGKDRVRGGQSGDVVKVGSLLTEILNEKGITTVHDKTINDALYVRAYDSSYEVGERMLKENPTIRILLDIHRDGLPPEVGKSVVKMGDKKVAKILIVIGQKNPNWKENSKIASDLIAIAEKKYPGFFFSKIRYASEARYNQHLTHGALLFEVGSQLNTLQEALDAVEPLAEVLKEYLEK